LKNIELKIDKKQTNEKKQVKQRQFSLKETFVQWFVGFDKCKSSGVCI